MHVEKKMVGGTITIGIGIGDTFEDDIGIEYRRYKVSLTSLAANAAGTSFDRCEALPK